MSSLAVSVKELWDTCSIPGLIILSLSLQCFLILFAPSRKQKSGKWFITILLWIAYLLADLVAVFTIGLILRAQPSGMLALWSSFLLLHLGGPDTITSYSIDDNKLWLRHLLGLLSRVGSSVYIILLSLSNDMLWLPTLLVLIAGIIKYAERNRAFYLASFDNIGNNWVQANEDMPLVPKQFKNFDSKLQWDSNPTTRSSIKGKFAKLTKDFLSSLPEILKLMNPLNVGQSDLQKNQQKPISIKLAVYLLGVIRNLLVGPPLTSFEKSLLPDDADGMLLAIEIQLSLLYELLHTKLPVVDSKTGYVCRIINLGCILGALVSFSLLNRHLPQYELLKFDIGLTYVLLIGALTLDLISIILLISSDWITMSHFQEKWKSDEFINKFSNKRRWSNSIPQLNIFTTCDILNKDGGLAKDSSDFLRLRILIRNIRRPEFKSFKKKQEWEFIFTSLQKKKNGSVDIPARARPIFDDLKLLINTYIHTIAKNISHEYEALTSSLEGSKHMDSLLIWHIVTECYYRREDLNVKIEKNDEGSSAYILDHRSICKLLSDYMFYLLVMEPTMITVGPNSWKIAFGSEDKDQITLSWLEKLRDDQIIIPANPEKEKRVCRIKRIACQLVNDLKSEEKKWEMMAEVWVWILCYAAVSCQPIVHARQVSKGGQLLTLIWLLMNYMELTHSGWFSSVQKTNQ